MWTTGTIQCLHQGILPSMTRTLPADTILPNKSQSFSIVWADNTDSICDLPSMLTYLDNHASNLHKADATRSSTTNRSARRVQMVRQPLPPSHLLPLSHGLLSLPAMLPRLHLLLPQESLRASPLAQGTSSIALQGLVLLYLRSSPLAQGTSSIVLQGLVLLSSLVNCSTRSVFLSSATFA